jgi:chromosome segregation ATPase
VVQRDGLQEQLDKMQKDWSRTQAELDAANRMHADLNERIANAERKVTSLNLDKDSLQSTIDELEKRLVQEQVLSLLALLVRKYKY